MELKYNILMKCVMCYNYVKQMLIKLQIWKSMNLFLFMLLSSKLRVSFIIHSFSRKLGGKWESLYPTVLSAEWNKQNISIHILCKGQFFLLWKEENLLKKKTLSSTLLTFQRIYYKHLRSRRNNKVYIALRVAGGKLVYQEYTYILRRFFVIV